MDNRSEESMVRQIEKNLSQNINENLWTPNPGTMNAIRVEETYFNGGNKVRRDVSIEDPEFPLVSYDHITDSLSTISRAEYIRQAREACLRQLSDLQVYSKPYDVNYMSREASAAEEAVPKKTKTWNLFREGHEERSGQESRQITDTKMEENTPQELAAFRFLIVRMVCAVVLFLSVFIFDKLELNVGNLTNEKVQEYITKNDVMDNIENYIVTWLK